MGETVKVVNREFLESSLVYKLHMNLVSVWIQLKIEKYCSKIIDFTATVYKQCINSSCKSHKRVQKKKKSQTQTLGFLAQSKCSLDPCVSTFTFSAFFFFFFWRVNSNITWIYYTKIKCTVYALFTGVTVLFTYLKIILLQYF